MGKKADATVLFIHNINDGGTVYVENRYVVTIYVVTIRDVDCAVIAPTPWLMLWVNTLHLSPLKCCHGHFRGLFYDLKKD